MATIRKRGSSFQVQVRLAGKPPMSKSFKTQGEAQKWARQIEGGSRDVRPIGETLGDLIERYLTECPSSLGQRDSYRLRRFQRDTIAQVRVLDLTTTDWLQYRHRRAMGGSSLTTVKRDLTPVSAVLQMANTIWGYSGLPNYVLETKGKVREIRRKRRLGTGELDTWLKAIDDQREHPGSLDKQMLKDVVVFASEVPFRLGEISRIQVKHLADFVKVFIPKSKTGEQRYVVMTKTATGILKRRCSGLGPNSFVFPFEPKKFTDVIRKTIKRAGLENFRFQDTKHEATSALFEAGLSAAEVMSQTGHTNLRTLSIYTHAQVESVLAKLQRA
jgi:integrase